MKFEKSRFLLSALHPNEFPNLKGPKGNFLPEIAMAGRSNVGKSSFINALLQTKALAKTSSTPGKTQRINFFLIDDSLLLVDLPGYGYARAPTVEVRKWSQAIDEYLESRKFLRILFLLIDIRREPTPEDLAMAEWANAKGISLFVVFTKRDKLSEPDAKRAVENSLSKLSGIKIAGTFTISNQNFYERRSFIQTINEELSPWA